MKFRKRYKKFIETLAHQSLFLNSDKKLRRPIGTRGLNLRSPFFLSRLPARLFSVRLGDHDLSSADDNTLPIDVDVNAVHRHPSYDRRTYSNDVAVLELSKEVSFNQFVQPVCLPFGEISKKDVTGYHGFIAGWGATQFSEFSVVFLFLPAR